MAPTSPYPDDLAPALTVSTLSGTAFNLLATAKKPENFTIVIFYRGLHCPICMGYLKEVEEGYQAAKEKGIDVIAISMDTQERAIKTEATVLESLGKGSGARAKNKLSLPIGYGLTEEQARSWGLYLSPGRPGTMEPAVFSEPALFVLKPDNSVYFIQIQNAPFTRPNILQLLGGLEYVLAHNYPTRGTLTNK